MTDESRLGGRGRISVGVPVDWRIERGRTRRHALAELMEHERFDRIMFPGQTCHSDGFPPDDIGWLL